MRKRMTSLLLTLVMLLSLVPTMGVTASAAEPEWTTVNSFDELKEAMQQGTKTNIKLGKDINTNDEENHKYGLTTYDKILVGNTITLDLNGKKLTLNSRQNKVSSYINVTLGNLTVQDSVGGGEIFLNDEYEGGSTLILLLDTATFTLKSGTIRATTKPETSGIDLIQSYGTVNIEGGTLTCTQTNGEIGRLHSDPNHWTSCYALNCFARDNVQTTITGGEFTGFVRIPVKNNGKQNKITNVTFDGSVVLDLADEKNMTWSKPGLTVENAEVKGTLFINGVCYHQKSTDIAIVIGNGWYATLDVNDTNVWVYDYDLFKQTYEANGNDVSKATFKQGYAPYQLKGGTYRFMNFGSKAEHDIGYRYTQEAFRHILGNGAIKVGNYDDDGYKIYTYSNIGESFKYGDYMAVMNSSWKRIPFIPNAWGMKSVTLDGNVINYAKDWNGIVENLTNDEAHTLKFEWNPLAKELKDAGYSYRAECDRYISGNKTPTTDPISATDTEYSFTIPADADPKVYSFALHLNLKKGDKNVGIFSNEHIVKLVVDEAQVVEPVPTLTGKVYYTSGIVFGSPISISASVTPAEATPAYQWQRSTDSGSTWTNIEGATSGKYTPVEDDMGDTVRIRVKVTANGYLGEIVGAPLTVSKAANDDTPRWPDVVAQKDGSDAYTKFEITNYNPKQEYVYTTIAPTSDNEWPTGGTPITSATVEGLNAGSTYYIYTRFKGTATHTAGSKISSSSVLMDEINRLNQIILTDENGKVYSSYGSGNTIYIKKGESLTLTATTNPDGANTWNDFKFKPRGFDTSSCFTVTAPTGSVVSGTEIPQVTIYGAAKGTDTLAAEYSGYTTESYGTWGVHVYENVSDIGTGAEITVSPSFPDMTMYQGETLPLPQYTVDVYPEGALENYDLAWRIIKVGAYGPSYKTSDDNITLENGKIEATKAHAVSGNTRLDLVAIDKTDNTKIRSLSPTSRFNVTVTEAPTIALTGVTVAPKKVNLNIGGSIQLSAVKEPVNATGDLSWSSDKPAVAEVDTTTGKVTAKAQGTAIITVSCNGKSADCTVLVAHEHNFDGQPWLYMNPGNHYQECKDNDGALNIEAHNFNAWTPNSDNTTHSRTCSKCKKSGEAEFYTETAEHNWQWVVDTAATPNAAGKQHEECVDCHAKRSENTEITMLTSIMVEHLTVTKPVKDATAAKATTTDSTYTVANTEWMAADGTPLAIGDKFQPGTVYTVKITLETAGAGVFSAKSTYNDIEGKTATVPPELIGNNYADSVILTYTFDKTAGGYHPGTGTGTGATTYPITVKSAKNGDVTASHKSASKGTTVTLTVDPDKGYVLDTLTVLDGKDKEIKLTEKNGKYTFTMPASKVTVEAMFKAAGNNPFTDVPAGSYYEDAVVWAVEKGITTGTSATTFNPNGICTRAQAVTFLWRAAGSPAAKTKVMPFADVKAGSYYYDAVLWAVEQGITKGTSDTMFSPDATCTRAQIVTFLWRANGSPAVSGNSAFTDVASDAYYAAAVTWAEKNDITGGIGGGLFGSNNNCTRAQIVTFIYRSVK